MIGVIHITNKLNGRIGEMELQNKKSLETIQSLEHKVEELELEVRKLKLQLSVKNTDNSDISYDYEEIKNRKISLHRELKRMYRLFNQSRKYEEDIPFALIVKSL